MTHEDISNVKSRLMDALEVFASDFVSYFTLEAGIEPFYCIELRDLARQIIREGEKPGGTWPRAILNRLPDEFFQMVEDILGREVVESIKKWVELAIPVRKTRVLLGQWDDCFKDLVEQWDAPKPVQSLPLSEPEAAQLRVKIRDHICHASNTLEEVDNVLKTGKFEWDNRPKPHLEPYKHLENDPVAMYRESLNVWSACSNYDNSMFWRGFAKKLSQKQVNDLLDWVSSLGRVKYLKAEGELYPDSIPDIL